MWPLRRLPLQVFPKAPSTCAPEMLLSVKERPIRFGGEFGFMDCNTGACSAPGVR
jgi:hypothetical protein